MTDPKAWADEFTERWLDAEDVRRSNVEARRRWMEAMLRYCARHELGLMRAFETQDGSDA